LKEAIILCGRYYLDEASAEELRDIIDEINRKHSGDGLAGDMKTGEIFPADAAPIITANGPAPMRWGVPQEGGRPTINARAETAAERPLFKLALRRRRVVVPTSGFYEWTHEGKRAVDKFWFRLPGENMLYLAGIVVEVPGARDRDQRFVILTTEANGSVSGYHDRMPVCLARGEIEKWLRDDSSVEVFLGREQPTLTAESVSPLRPEQMSFF